MIRSNALVIGSATLLAARRLRALMQGYKVESNTVSVSLRKKKLNEQRAGNLNHVFITKPELLISAIFQNIKQM